jgi:hypothetical protein
MTKVLCEVKEAGYLNKGGTPEIGTVELCKEISLRKK